MADLDIIRERGALARIHDFISGNKKPQPQPPSQQRNWLPKCKEKVGVRFDTHKPDSGLIYDLNDARKQVSAFRLVDIWMEIDATAHSQTGMGAVTALSLEVCCPVVRLSGAVPQRVDAIFQMESTDLLRFQQPGQGYIVEGYFCVTSCRTTITP